MYTGGQSVCKAMSGSSCKRSTCSDMSRGVRIALVDTRLPSAQHVLQALCKHTPRGAVRYARVPRTT